MISTVPTAKVSAQTVKGSGRGAPRRSRRRFAGGVAAALLVLVSGLALALVLALAVLRRELKARADRDTRPCVACRSPAVLEGRALLDEQGHRLLFATPEQAEKYASDYAQTAMPDAAR